MTEAFILGAIFVVVILTATGLDWLIDGSNFAEAVTVAFWALMFLTAGFGAVRAFLTILLE